jgi:DNA polymerase I
MCGGSLTTLWGWTWRAKGSSVDPRTGRLKEPNDRTARNWLMQAYGGEMLRCAVTLAAERGLGIVAVIHDALLVECDHDRLAETRARVEDVMGDASAATLDGFKVAVDQTVISWPDRFSDERGVATWRLVHRLLDERGL